MAGLLEIAGPARKSEGPGAVLLRVFETLDRAGLPYCVLDSYERYHACIPQCSDVDCVMPAEVLPFRLAALLHANRGRIGADIVSWDGNMNHYITMTFKDLDGQPRFLHLDAHPGYWRAGRLFYSADEVLGGRRRYDRFWVPATDIEFGCYLVKKVAKGSLNEEHGRRLGELYRRDPTGCERQIARFWGGDSTDLIASAAAAANWAEVRCRLAQIRAELLRRVAVRHPLQTGRSKISGVVRRARRWWRPMSGFHLVLLGPDGVGKTTLLDAVRQSLAPVFNGNTDARTFAPALLSRCPQAPSGRPHEKAARSVPESVAKALYWLLYYSLGYHLTVRPALARSTLVLNHRYLIDALADPKRYRYGGPLWILHLVWRLSVKPDLVILLDAPAEVVQARKREVPFEETARQREVYQSLVGGMSNGTIIDATQPIEKEVAEVNEFILRFLAARIARRFHLEPES